MKNPEHTRKVEDIPSQVKDPDLIGRRRRQIVDAAVRLFIEKGFHKTTTREIARESGISTGLLYEYVSTKEDVLYLVCDAIHAEVEAAVAEAVQRVSGGRNVLAAMIREYFLVCDRMSDHILLVYQETKALPEQWRNRVLENEIKLTNIFVSTLEQLARSGDLARLPHRSLELIAHNITVLGHMWTFRRWFLSRHYTIEDYIKRQTDFILGRSTNKETP
ncbi:MAG: TetR/AcrR family transcriptional regulator [Candidatus Aminicenantaceae bacterium]